MVVFQRIHLAVWRSGVERRGRRRRREVIKDGRRRREGRRGAVRVAEDTTGSDFKGPATTGLYWEAHML